MPLAEGIEHFNPSQDPNMTHDGQNDSQHSDIHKIESTPENNSADNVLPQAPSPAHTGSTVSIASEGETGSTVSIGSNDSDGPTNPTSLSSDAGVTGPGLAFPTLSSEGVLPLLESGEGATQEEPDLNAASRQALPSNSATSKQPGQDDSSEHLKRWQLKQSEEDAAIHQQPGTQPQDVGRPQSSSQFSVARCIRNVLIGALRYCRNRLLNALAILIPLLYICFLIDILQSPIGELSGLNLPLLRLLMWLLLFAGLLNVVLFAIAAAVGGMVRNMHQGYETGYMYF